VSEPLAGVDVPALGTDEADGVLCALTAACHENQGLRHELPGLWFPEDDRAGADYEPDRARLVRREGWICLPG